MKTTAKIQKLLEEFSLLAPAGFSLAMRVEFTTPAFLFHTFSQKWSDIYAENGYMLKDPVVHWGLQNSGTIRWSEITPYDSAFFDHAADHGLVFGCTCASDTTQFPSFASFARNDREYADDEIAQLNALFLELDQVLNNLDFGTASVRDELRKLAASFSPTTMH